MKAETYELNRNGIPSVETEYTRTWWAKHGHRWVCRGGKYYPASPKDIAIAKEKARGLMLPAPVGVAR